jgi:uncharacterized protein (TIGR03066 family)
MLRIFTLFAVLFSLAPVLADEKSDEKLLLGKWEQEDKPNGATVKIEFKERKAFNVTITMDGRDQKLEGTFKLEKDKLTTTINRPDGTKTERTLKVKSLKEKELILEKEDSGEEQKYKKE